MGLAHYMLRRYGEAVRWLREGASRLPNQQGAHAASMRLRAGWTT
jgi:hypothetical protein